jgi:hypothetical protein
MRVGDNVSCDGWMDGWMDGMDEMGWTWNGREGPDELGHITMIMTDWGRESRLLSVGFRWKENIYAQ